MVDLDGTNLRQVTHLNNYLFLSRASWSPDGTRFAVQGSHFADAQAWRQHLGKTNIWVMDADGTNLKQVTTEDYAVMPSWIPSLD